VTILRLLLGVLLWWTGAAVHAHEIRPVSMEITEIAEHRYKVRWKVPAVEGRFLAVRPRFASNCTGWQQVVPRPEGDSAVARFELRCTQGLEGTRLVLENLNRTMIDGVVTVEWLSGETSVTHVKPTDPHMIVPQRTGASQVIADFIVIGIEHILFGPDHLLFVLALLLLVDSWRRLLVTATAFTVAHSLTLSLAALRVISVPVPPVEALIALSIVYLAFELVRKARGEDRGQQRPWLLVFSFGLLHGLGFASALSEVGLPMHEVPAALFAFNLGVELGQVAFILVVFGLREFLRRSSPRLEHAAYWSLTYLIGGLASFWVIDRIAQF
jgi:hydrogenase/urease accessory protein HupE